MSQEPQRVQISADYEVAIPAKDIAYPVPKADWDYLKEKVIKIESGSWLYQTIGSVSLGIAGSAFIALITLPAAPPLTVLSQETMQAAMRTQTVELLCWLIGLSTLIIGLICLSFASRERDAIISARQDVIDEMSRMEQRVQLRQPAADLVPDLIILSATYGVGDTQNDVTDLLRTRLARNNMESITVAALPDELGGDPAIGIRKQLVVDYQYKEARYQIRLNDGDRLSLP